MTLLETVAAMELCETVEEIDALMAQLSDDETAELFKAIQAADPERFREDVVEAFEALPGQSILNKQTGTRYVLKDGRIKVEQTS